MRPYTVKVQLPEKERYCAWCGGPVEARPGPGRPRRFCRNSHRQRAYEARIVARRRALATDEVVLSRRGWEAIRDALARLKEATTDLAGDLAAGRAPSADYAAAVATLAVAVSELQEASEPRAAW